ncbi:UNVERIFIED_ORG: vancomycin permeability regulator SanA [Paraburkholderia sediminicola]|uniref:YdcF family protein n=1 Tax=Paraburkholderia aspalathi TaxID=1324617 RepID=UPI0021128826|nr:vancomycin permeability regulator SanA [Paraburkholderia sediminicola]
MSLIVVSVGLLSKPQKADLAIVYGNEVHADGSPSGRLSARLDEALHCYAKGICHEIMVSGGVEKQGVDEALAMKNYLVAKGVPQGRIVMDNMGLNTWDTARNASAYMNAHDLHSALVVSQYFHIPRATIALKRFGVEHVSGVYPEFFEIRDFYSVIREAPAVLWYCVRGGA